MKAHIIALSGVPQSMALAERAISSARVVGIDASVFEAVDQANGPNAFNQLNFKISKRFNSSKILHRKENFRDGMTGPECGAFMSHYRLWHHCAAIDEPIIIAEHDAIFINPLIPNFDFKDICVLTHRTASWLGKPLAPLWDDTPGVKPYHCWRFISAVCYAIKPHAARRLINYAHTTPVSEVDNFINTRAEDDYPAKDIIIERHDPCVAIHPPVNEFSTINHELLKKYDPWK